MDSGSTTPVPATRLCRWGTRCRTRRGATSPVFRAAAGLNGSVSFRPPPVSTGASPLLPQRQTRTPSVDGGARSGGLQPRRALEQALSQSPAPPSPALHSRRSRSLGATPDPGPERCPGRGAFGVDWGVNSASEPSSMQFRPFPRDPALAVGPVEPGHALYHVGTKSLRPGDLGEAPVASSAGRLLRPVQGAFCV